MEALMRYDPKIHHRRSIRLEGYDYTQRGAYFVTLNVAQRDPIFGEVIDDEVRLSPIGEIVRDYWLRLPQIFPIDLDAWVIMPDHLHGVIVMGEAFGGQNLGMAVGSHAPNASPLHAHRRRPHGTHPDSLGAVVQNFKSVTTRKVNQQRGTPGGPVWQRNYYEHVVRDEGDLERIRRYITANPFRWSQGVRDP
jgi:REP element-mobilizing transposase RayT